MHYSELRITKFLRNVRRTVIRRTRIPGVGHLQLGDLDRCRPIDRNWGFDRGTPVDRYFIEKFLEENRSEIHGTVLEVADNQYTLDFGGDRVTESFILHDTVGHPRATLVADLAAPDLLPDTRFSCIICTQTLHLIYDMSAAMTSLHRLLRPQGVLLLTAPAISKISRADMNRHGDYWRFTSAALQRLTATHFGETNTLVRHYGNVYAATAFLHGLAAEELDQQKLDHVDADYEVLVGVKAVKRDS